MLNLMRCLKVRVRDGLTVDLNGVIIGDEADMLTKEVTDSMHQLFLTKENGEVCDIKVTDKVLSECFEIVGIL